MGLAEFADAVVAAVGVVTNWPMEDWPVDDVAAAGATRDAAGRRTADSTIQLTADSAGAPLPCRSDSAPPMAAGFADEVIDVEAMDVAGVAIAAGALCWPAAAFGCADRRDRGAEADLAVPEAELAVDVSSAGPAHAAPA